jgi:cysteinyl-tRNA synthetase
MIQERLLARANKNYREADRIRDELMSASIILEDTAKGTSWRRC